MAQTIVTFYPRRCIPESKVAHWFDGLELEPGINYLSDEQLDQLTKHPDYPRYDSFGAIAIQKPNSNNPTPQTSPTPAPDQKDNPPNLNNYGPDDAKKLINDQTDPSVLESWLQLEQRKNVRSAIQERLAALPKASAGSTNQPSGTNSGASS